MRNKLATTLVAVASLLAVSFPLLAHHGSAAFETDASKRVVLKGTVTEWFWANPHCFLKFDVTDASGQVAHWVAETSNPSDMTDRGWSKQAIKPGDQVTVTLRPIKSGGPLGSVVQVVLPDGKTLSANQ